MIFNGFAYADWVALSLALRYQLYIFASVKMYVTQHLMFIALGNLFEAGARDELLYLVGSDEVERPLRVGRGPLGPSSVEYLLDRSEGTLGASTQRGPPGSVRGWKHLLCAAASGCGVAVGKFCVIFRYYVEHRTESEQSGQDNFIGLFENVIWNPYFVGNLHQDFGIEGVF